METIRFDYLKTFLTVAEHTVSQWQLKNSEQAKAQ